MNDNECDHCTAQVLKETETHELDLCEWECQKLVLYEKVGEGEIREIATFSLDYLVELVMYGKLA